LQVFLVVKLLQTCSVAQHVVFVLGYVCVLIAVAFVDQTAECWLIVVVKVSEAVAVAVVTLQVVVEVVQLVVQGSLEPSWLGSLGKGHRELEVLDLLVVDEALVPWVVVHVHP